MNHWDSLEYLQEMARQGADAVWDRERDHETIRDLLAAMQAIADHADDERVKLIADASLHQNRTFIILHMNGENR